MAWFWLQIGLCAFVVTCDDLCDGPVSDSLPRLCSVFVACFVASCDWVVRAFVIGRIFLRPFGTVLRVVW